MNLKPGYHLKMTLNFLGLKIVLFELASPTSPTANLAVYLVAGTGFMPTFLLKKATGISHLNLGSAFQKAMQTMTTRILMTF